MPNFIVTNRQEYFEAIGQYNYCNIASIILPKEIAYDSETEGLKPFNGEIFAIQIGTGKDNYLFDIESLGINPVLELIKDKTLVIHNALFDLTWLYKYNFFPWKVRDTLLASQIINNGIPFVRNGFQYVMERELGVEYDKSEQKNISKIKLSTAKAIQYCFNDVDKLLELKKSLHKKIYEGGYVSTYNLHCKWIRALAYMQACGTPLNKVKWQQKIDNDIKEMNEKEAKIKDYITSNLPEYRNNQLSLFSSNTNNVTINLNSPLQMIPIFEKLGINVIDDKAKSGKSISENIINKTKHPFVDLWLDYQGIKHDVTTFGENFFPSIRDNRLYTSYKPLLDTARISAGGKNRDKTEVDDINTLNIPANKKSREPFEANEGFDYIVADYEGQENVCTADMTGDEVMIKSITEGLDLHCAFARMIYPYLKDLSDEEIKKSFKKERQSAKAPRFALAFGGTGFTIHKNEGIPLEEANNIEKLYKELHPGIIEFGKKTLEKALEKEYIEYAKGFKLHLPYFDSFKKLHQKFSKLDRNWWDQYKLGKKEKDYPQNKRTNAYNHYMNNYYDLSQYYSKKGEYLRLCLNAPSQGTAAHQTKAATNKIYEYIYKHNHFWKARIALVVHDEINMEVVRELSAEYKQVIEKAMIDEGNKYLTNPRLFMSTEAKIGKNWYEAK